MNPPYEVDPWHIRETELDLGRLAQTESVFALSNGHIGVRGNLDEGEPSGLPGSYLNSLYEQRPLPYAEAGYGYPESGETVINVTNGKIIRLLVDDEPLDVRFGDLESHERVLDMRAGTLERTMRWRSPAGARIRLCSTRIVSLTQRAIMAIKYEVEPLDEEVQFVVQSELVANEPLPGPRRPDPRVAAVLDAPLASEEHFANDDRVLLVHQTRVSGLRMAAAMSHEIESPNKRLVDSEAQEDVGRVTVATRLKPGEKLSIVKYVAYGWSSHRSRSALHDQVAAALAGAELTGWDGFVEEQAAYLRDFWEGVDVEVDGDPEVQQAVRFALFHILQAGARAERRMIPAKGLTGPGYDGHTFWDTETFVLPVLTYSVPDAAADALRWRHSTIPQALDRAAQLNLPGTCFPWRTISGRECSGYWPAGTAAFHINADIAEAVGRYIDATQDEEFAREIGVELLVHTARLWRGIGHHDLNGAFRIHGVTGPDEYSAVADNNVYTNLMAQANLREAADVALAMPEEASRLGVTAEEAASWRDAADKMLVPYDERLGVHPQSAGFTDHAPWDFLNTPPRNYPLLLHYPYFDLYRKQVIKQADLVLAMQLCGNAFTAEQKERNFSYYEALTVRDSSLSAQTQAVMAAEVGYLELAHDYLAETALMDLRDLAHDTANGLHLASLAGAWNALVSGFGGLRRDHGALCFAPRLPETLGRLSFRLRYRGSLLCVTVHPRQATYSLRGGPPLRIIHHGEEHLLEKADITLPIPRAQPTLPPPHQPPGRAPRRHHEPEQDQAR
ncbi:glycoside hydrolase family 65 protein [Actinocorallia sp. API 0066]|uniref:glycoside hydrolase family 65 protein n=1 Tax=Actinocorallia sp. API 0066 TaxID=2896846 RepID=UPI001E38F454|nr:glycoside hydrolase family 65 protein [Actinocorallia sp. API 0066]MCD0452880.1 glycoside hydrolase family 65 protein [Actinocorallia sp. API 0066]